MIITKYTRITNTSLSDSNRTGNIQPPIGRVRPQQIEPLCVVSNTWLSSAIRNMREQNKLNRIVVYF